MNLLYVTKYTKRFENIISLINTEDKKILELCFGDIYIAEYAKKKKKTWIGMDINEKFILYARDKGYNALHENVMSEQQFPKSDVCIMSGSLYHFIEDIEFILKKMLLCSPKVIISEPISNLSNNKYLSFLAKKSANVGYGHEEFRFTEDSFLDTLDQYAEILLYSYNIIKKDRDILVVLYRK